MSTTFSKGLLLSHMRSIASFLLKIMSSGGMVALNRNGGNEKVEQEEIFWEIFSNSFCTLVVAFSGLALLKRL